MNKLYIIGILLAIGAGVANGTVGVLSKGIFEYNLTPTAVSFYKCFIAFIALSIIIFSKKSLREKLFKDIKVFKLAVCSFLGIFVLYYFETTAYNYTTVPTVVFILLGTSVVVTFILSTFLLAENKKTHQYIGFILLVIGLACMIGYQQMNFVFNIGILLAIIAGVGYGLFLVLTKKFRIDGGLISLWYLIGFGCVYLIIPFTIEGVVLPQTETVIPLLALAILPTLVGFYCTVKALTLIEANKVQLFELTEPIFASIFAYIFFLEIIEGFEWVGAFLILLAMYFSEFGERFSLKRRTANLLDKQR
ncbi:DMT family transporter [Shouchella patagoniensis]|uniref:DMT family transporter n=1 Tax=Shouchella patagoniensis TaxID=228576 RepID=UPI00099539B3|nr:DMT family transporter [Shouchella patagoniensis]